MKRHLSDWVIIMMCLLLSGDIHQCPGPVSRDFEGIISGDSDMRPRVSTVEQCRNSEIAVEWSSIADCWRDLLPCFETRDVIRMENGVVDVLSTSEEGGRTSRTPRPRAGSVEEDVQLSRDQMTSEINEMRDICTLKGLHMVHLNVRSLLPKISELWHLCQEFNVSLFGYSETWLDDSILDAEIHIANYCLLRSDRNRKGGGVCAYPPETQLWSFCLCSGHYILVNFSEISHVTVLSLDVLYRAHSGLFGDTK